MGKNKKRLKMQKTSEEQAMRQLFEQYLSLGLLDQVGYNEHGEPLYQISPNAEAQLEVLRKIADSDPYLDP